MVALDPIHFHERLMSTWQSTEHSLSYSSEFPSGDEEGNELSNLDAGGNGISSLLHDRNPISYSSSPAILQPSLRKAMFTGLFMTTVVLLANISIAIWCKTVGTNSDSGIVTVYEGSCSRTRTIIDVSALAINILSTLLLAASNNCAQFLGSPTRAEVDRAHARGAWLDIGVFGFRNIRTIRSVRSLLWAALLLSSVPLHLLWNSVIFSGLPANEYLAVLVTPDFFKTDGYNETYAAVVWQLGTELLTLHNNASRLQKLDNAACIQAYGIDPYESSWSNVLLVTNTTLGQPQTVLGAWEHVRTDNDFGDDLGWICGQRGSFVNGTTNTCDTASVVANASSWQIPDIHSCAYVTHNVSADNPFGETVNCIGQTASFSAPISYCLAEEFRPPCTVDVYPPLLWTVIVCNIAKVLCILATLRLRNFQPLATFGDAVSSFLIKPDPTTVGLGPISAVDVRDATNNGGFKYVALRDSVRPWKAPRLRWYSALSRRKWIIGTFLFLATWFAALLILLLAPGRPSSWSSIWALGLGFNSLKSSTTLFNASSSLAANILTANAFQLTLSLLYVIYNHFFTAMLLSHETSFFSDLANGRAPLRASFPLPGQRSAYYLQLPPAYALAIMAAVGSLHFIISRAIFVVNINVYSTLQVRAAADSMSACGWSPEGVVIALILGGGLMLVLHLFGARRLRTGMPLLRSCSVAISAACHPGLGEDPATKSVAYGVIHDGAGAERVEARVGFSSLEVGLLENGVVYR